MAQKLYEDGTTSEFLHVDGLKRHSTLFLFCTEEGQQADNGNCTRASLVVSNMTELRSGSILVFNRDVIFLSGYCFHNTFGQTVKIFVSLSVCVSW